MSQPFPSPTQLSPSRLAYLGDAVWELLVREKLVEENTPNPSTEALRYVTARAQASASGTILPLLTEEEESVWRRGRNMGHSNIPKSATLAEYCAATGLECLFGWLYLMDRRERLRELFSLSFSPEAIFSDRKKEDGDALSVPPAPFDGEDGGRIVTKP